jgi:hypothetical protein
MMQWARLRVSASTAVTAALSPEEADGILVDLLEEVIELGVESRSS